MPLSVQILALIAAALHVLFFYLESVVFTKPSTWKGFGIESQADADVIKPMALNQGFYNLFLALGIVVGVIWQWSTTDPSSWTAYAPLSGDAGSGNGLPHFTPGWSVGVVVFALLCMLAASLVLIISSRGKLLRGALIQGLVPAIALLIALVA